MPAYTMRPSPATPEPSPVAPSASRRTTWHSIVPGTPTARGLGGLGIHPCSRLSPPITKGQDEEPSQPNAAAVLTTADANSQYPCAGMHTGARIAVAPTLGCTVHGVAIKGAVQDRVLPSPVPASRGVYLVPQHQDGTIESPTSQTGSGELCCRVPPSAQRPV